MNRLIRTLALLTALVAAPLAAFADDTGGWYVGGTAGAVFPGGLSNQSFVVTSGGVTASGVQGFNLDTGLSLGAQVGYQMDQIRLEGEFLYQNYGRNGTTFTTQVGTAAPTTVSVGGPDISTYSGFFNGYYDFKTTSKWTPYLGAGIGVTHLDSSSTSTSGSIVQAPGLNKSVFAYQAKAGLAYQMSAASSAFLQYRYTGTAGFNYGGATVTIGGTPISVPAASGSLSNHTVELGLRFKI